MLDIYESGSLCCWREDDENKSFNSEYAKKGVTFENSLDIHTDEELKNTEIEYSFNNWFNVSCGTEEESWDDPDPDVLYSLEEALNAEWVRKMFEKAAA